MQTAGWNYSKKRPGLWLLGGRPSEKRVGKQLIDAGIFQTAFRSGKHGRVPTNNRYAVMLSILKTNASPKPVRKFILNMHKFCKNPIHIKNGKTFYNKDIFLYLYFWRTL
ncbi:hypothetical protein [Neisseria sp. CCUG12390]|uniref:hypothetical protein n=1 Tax=Neisseria sp. CCUG12390 TaxID=3392035 RepID=UPI003A0FCBB3